MKKRVVILALAAIMICGAIFTGCSTQTEKEESGEVEVIFLLVLQGVLIILNQLAYENIEELGFWIVLVWHGRFVGRFVQCVRCAGRQCWRGCGGQCGRFGQECRDRDDYGPPQYPQVYRPACGAREAGANPGMRHQRAQRHEPAAVAGACGGRCGVYQRNYGGL